MTPDDKNNLRHCFYHKNNSLPNEYSSLILVEMDLSLLKDKVKQFEKQMIDQPYVFFDTFERNQRKLQVAFTERFYRICKKARVWNTPAFLTALKNAQYGFDENHARSLGGSDGIFLLDRTFKPKNPMMMKIFDGYLNKPKSGIEKIMKEFDILLEQIRAVRLVSHHLRLLGIFIQKPEEDWLILVDYDDTK